MFSIRTTKRFDKAVRRIQKRGLDLAPLIQVVDMLRQTGSLPKEYRPHVLSGNYDGVWECHIKNDWLLLWKQDNDEMTLLMLNTGTHSDLF